MVLFVCFQTKQSRLHLFSESPFIGESILKDQKPHAIFTSENGLKSYLRWDNLFFFKMPGVFFWNKNPVFLVIAVLGRQKRRYYHLSLKKRVAKKS